MTATKKAKPLERPSTDDDWRLLFVDDDPTATVSTRTDVAIAAEVGMSKQYVQRRREALGIAKHVPPVEIETPPADAPIRVVAGWRIRQHRARHGWSGVELAQALGGSWGTSSVTGVELARSGRGRRGLTVETLGQFADALHVSPADLLLRPGQTQLLAPPKRPSPDVGEGQGGHMVLDAWERIAAAHRDLAAVARPDIPIVAVIGLNLGRWRIGRGLPQAELGTQPMISDLERGGLRGLSLETLDGFALALDVTPADLVRLPRQPALVLVESC